MTTIVQRRFLPPREAEGPGARLKALTWVGWLSLVGAIGLLVSSWWFLLDLGEPREVDVLSLLPQLAADTIGPASIALVAALEWGVPGARQRVPWLWRGSVLLAVAAVLSLGIHAAQGWVMDAVFESEFGTIEGDPRWIALGLLRLGRSLVVLGGWWAIADGLADSGARLSRRAILGAVAVGVLPLAVAWIVNVAMSAAYSASGQGDVNVGIGWLEIGGYATSFLIAAVSTVAAARLVAGWRVGLLPRSAWVVGAVAGGLMIADQVVSAMSTIAYAFQVFALVAPFSFVTGFVPPILLLIAFALGLGRGRWRRPPFVPGFRRAGAAG